MARAPKNNTPLRQLRKALGKSQKEFAADLLDELDLPPATYKKYEQGRALPEELANRLMILVSVDPRSLLKKEGTLRDIAGKPYSSASRSLFADRERGYTTEALLGLLMDLSDRYLVVLLAAHRVQRLTEAAYVFEKAIHESVHGLGLSKEIADLSSTFHTWNSLRTALLGAPFKFPRSHFIPRGRDYETKLRCLIEKGQGKKRKQKA